MERDYARLISNAENGFTKKLTDPDSSRSSIIEYQMWTKSKKVSGSESL